MKTPYFKKYLATALAATLFCAVSQAQISRTVMVDSSNSVILYPTNFWAPNAVAARSGLGLGSAATNPASAFQPSSLTLSNLASNNAVNLTNLNSTNLVGTIPISKGGTGSTNAADARNSLGLGSAATNPSSAFQLSSVVLSNLASNNAASLTNLPVSGVVGLQSLLDTKLATNGDGSGITNITAANITGTVALASNLTATLPIANGGSGATTAGGARTNLGLPWTGLTNVDSSSFQSALFGSGTNPVLVNSTGAIVSPTNFWKEAPLATSLQNVSPVANATNAANSGRLLFLFSLAPTTVGVTNTITLPTNGNTFNGDVATITHSGPTSSVTQIRQLGESTNLITINQPEETIRFLYRENQWTLMDNISQIEPIYFSGTNAAANRAVSRTNLGLGAIWLTNTNLNTFRADIGLGINNSVNFLNILASGTLTSAGNVTATTNLNVGGALTSTGTITAVTNLNVGGAIAVTNAAATRTNLGLGGGITTNLILKNSANVDTYMNFSNGILIYGSTTAP